MGKGLITFGIGIASWFIKDLLIKLAIKRNEKIQNEWKYRLTKVWSPLFYWSGVVTLSDSHQNWEKHGINKLEELLSKCAYLLPLEHYYILVKVIENATNQNTSPIQIEEVKKVRDYIYKQVELLNYLLYKKEDIFELGSAIDVLSPYRTFLRTASIFCIHLILWIVIGGLIIFLYIFYINNILWPLIIFGVTLLIIMFYDIKTRLKINQEIQERLK
ncbi:hypothetical protein J7L48_10145 [bacterium]|nr:hypothetical protein [bacterium]